MGNSIVFVTLLLRDIGEDDPLSVCSQSVIWQEEQVFLPEEYNMVNNNLFYIKVEFE